MNDHIDSDPVFSYNDEDDLPTPDSTVDSPDTPASDPSVDTPAQDAPIPDSDRICRICYGGQEDADELGRLISPCKCKGTMKYVHLECLNEWRRVSNKRESSFECDHCRYKYSFQRTTWAKAIMNEGVVTLITILVFILLALFGGLVMKLIIKHYYLPNMDPDPDDIFFVDPSNLSLTRLDMTHMLSGIVFIGMLGFFQMILTVFSAPVGLPRTRGGWFRTGRGEGNQVGNIIMLVVVAVGVVRAFMAIYKGVKWYCRRSLKVLESAILEVDEDA